MTQTDVDTARLTLALNERRMPAIKALWPHFAGQADKKGWPAARFLGAWVEDKLADRERRRIERHVSQARLLPGKTSDTFDFAAGPMLSKAHVNAVIAGDSGIEKADNIVLFGPPGMGKSHLSSAIGLALVKNGYGVFCSPAREIWSRSSNRRDATSRWRVPPPNSTSSICWFLMTSLASQRIRPGPACCSNWSAQDMSPAQP